MKTRNVASNDKSPTTSLPDFTSSIFGRDLKALALALGAEPDRFDAQGRSGLALAAACGYEEVAGFLLDRGADVNQANTDKLAYTPLIEASREGKSTMARFLLSRGAKVDAVDSRNGAALLHACITADLQTATLLAEHGAKIDAEDNRGQTALHYLCQNARP